jgi:hypothetical protein
MPLQGRQYAVRTVRGLWRLVERGAGVGLDHTRGVSRLSALAASIVALVVVASSVAIAATSLRLGSRPQRVQLPTYEVGDSRPLAVVSGRLILRDGCVYLGSPSVPDEYLVVWPIGYYESDDAVRDASGRAVAGLDENVSLDGGEGPAVGDAWLEDHVLSPSWMPTCSVRAYWLTWGVAST